MVKMPANPAVFLEGYQRVEVKRPRGRPRKERPVYIPHPCDLCGTNDHPVSWLPPLLARVCEECRDQWLYRQQRLRGGGQH